MTTPSDTPDWRSMSQEERDLGLNNGVHVPASARPRRRLGPAFPAEKRAQYSDHLDLRYGPRERNRIDFFKAGENAPTLLFIHGGYWQTRAKETFALFSDGPMAHGINVALTGYTLAPDATLDEIVGEIHAGIDYLAGQLPALGGDGQSHRGGRLVRRRPSHLDGAVEPECAGRGWRYRASTTSSRSATAISTSSSGSTKRPRAATRR